MSTFNEKQLEAMFGGDYICSKCGAKMEFEDEWRDNLICPRCGHEVDIDHYGFDSEEDYNALYPTEEDLKCGITLTSLKFMHPCMERFIFAIILSIAGALCTKWVKRAWR